jgi:glycerate kinase
MRILIVSDSFKESLSATEVAAAIASGLASFSEVSTCVQLPFSDGGEGALDLLERLFEGSRIETHTVDALGRPIKAPYFRFKDRPAAWIELSQASGLWQIEPELRDPRLTSTYGTGIQIKHALDAGCTQIYLGVGGSATNDAGAGILSALGGLFSNAEGELLEPGGLALQQLAHIDVEAIPQFNLSIASDVEHTLLGPKGATHTFAPQKGADAGVVQALESALSQFADQVKRLTNIDCSTVTKGGAAGGTSAGLNALLGAELVSGFELLADLANLNQKIADADLVITAEGQIDSQTLGGKLPSALSERCTALGKPLIAFCGALKGSAEPLFNHGFSGVFSIQPGPISLEESKENAAELLEAAVSRVFHFHFNTPQS